MVVALFGIAVTSLTVGLNWPLLLVVWLIIGLGYSTVQTPSGRLLRRSAHAGDRPAVFAAQFALSHACWLITYPLSGWLMTSLRAGSALVVLAGLATVGIVAALWLWPAGDPEVVEHTHDNMPLDHPHLQGRKRHSHALVIDDAHPHWGSQF